MRRIYTLLTFVMLAIVFCGLATGCGKKGYCERCGQKEMLHKHEYHYYENDYEAYDRMFENDRYANPYNIPTKEVVIDVWVCDDCWSMMKRGY